jgi:hypothetical protein
MDGRLVSTTRKCGERLPLGEPPEKLLHNLRFFPFEIYT